MRLVKVTAHSFFIGRKIFILFYIMIIQKYYNYYFNSLV